MMKPLHRARVLSCFLAWVALMSWAQRIRLLQLPEELGLCACSSSLFFLFLFLNGTKHQTQGMRAKHCSTIELHLQATLLLKFNPIFKVSRFLVVRYPSVSYLMS